MPLRVFAGMATGILPIRIAAAIGGVVVVRDVYKGLSGEEACSKIACGARSREKSSDNTSKAKTTYATAS